MICLKGGYNMKIGKDIDSIYEFNSDSEQWKLQKYNMGRPRYFFGLSLVNFKDYSDACKK